MPMPVVLNYLSKIHPVLRFKGKCANIEVNSPLLQYQANFRLDKLRYTKDCIYCTVHG